MKILIIYADPGFASRLGNFLEQLGVTVDYAATSFLGIQLAKTLGFDVIIVANDLLGMDGFEVCRTLRGKQGLSTPIMMLGLDAGLKNTLAALEAGADDYRLQTDAFAEVYARLRTLSRRRKAGGVLKVGDLRFDPLLEEVYRGDVRLRPTPTGLKLLRALMAAAPRLLTFAELEVHLWGEDSVQMSEANLRVHIHALRAVVDKPFATPLIRTYRGIGYCMVDHLPHLARSS